jgi:hypothetical protein
VATRFKLPEAEVDMVIAEGRDALRANTVFRQFLGSVKSNQIVGPRVHARFAPAAGHVRPEDEARKNGN